jgi:hypothetical protein
MSTPSSDVSVRPRGASNAPSPSGRKAGVVTTSTGGRDVERLTGSIGAVVHGLDALKGVLILFVVIWHVITKSYLQVDWQIG